MLILAAWVLRGSSGVAPTDTGLTVFQILPPPGTALGPAGGLARRSIDCVRGKRCSDDQRPHLRPPARLVHDSAAARHRGGFLAVLVARQPIHRVLRAEQVKEDCRFGRTSAIDLSMRLAPWEGRGTPRARSSSHDHWPLKRVSAAGGEPTATGPEPAANDMYLWPSFLPDGRHFLFNVRSEQPGKSGVYVGSLDSQHHQTSR